MTTLVVPDRLLPNRRLPRVKPTGGNTTIDWANPITRGLKTAVLCENGGFNTLIDDPLFPNGWEFFSTGGDPTGNTHVHDGAQVAGNRCCIRSVDSINMNGDRQQGTSLQHFRYSKANATMPQYAYYFYTYSYDRHGAYLGGSLDASKWFATAVDFISSDLDDILAGAVNQEYVISYSWDYVDGVDPFKIWCNGDSEATAVDTAAMLNDYYCIGGRDDGDQRYCNGVVKTFFMWDRVLTDAEQKSMSIDPYQFLRSGF